MLALVLHACFISLSSRCCPINFLVPVSWFLEFWFVLDLSFRRCLLHLSHLLLKREGHFNHATVTHSIRLQSVRVVPGYTLHPRTHLNRLNRPWRDAAESVACSLHSFYWCFTHQGQTGAQGRCLSKGFDTDICRCHFTHLPYLSRSAMQIATYDAMCHVHPQGIYNVCVYIRV